LKAYKFRIYPSKQQGKQLSHHLWVEKELWNEMLDFTKKTYSDFGKFPTKETLRSFCKNNELYSQVGQELVERLSKSIWRMVALRKKGKECGFPRFKSFDRMKSLNYPQSGFWLEKKLKVTPFGEINIKQHRLIKGIIKTLSLKREPSGKWFAVFCVEETSPVKATNGGTQVGIDLGLKTLATLSDGTIIKNPRHLEKHEEKLAMLQRSLSMAKRGSKNRRKIKRKVAIEYEKVANTRADFLHKTTTSLANSYSLIAMETLASQEMAEQNFGKSINDAGWGMFANMLRYKAESAGCQVVFVNPKNTTQECSRCHEIVKKDLTVRAHDCPFCNLVMDRDLNAAHNILIRATAGHAGSNACGDETTVSSVKQEAHIL
jgi:putative transposase